MFPWAYGQLQLWQCDKRGLCCRGHGDAIQKGTLLEYFLLFSSNTIAEQFGRWKQEKQYHFKHAFQGKEYVTDHGATKLEGGVFPYVKVRDLTSISDV